jgi:hypothetical protein
MLVMLSMVVMSSYEAGVAISIVQPVNGATTDSNVPLHFELGLEHSQAKALLLQVCLYL